MLQNKLTPVLEKVYQQAYLPVRSEVTCDKCACVLDFSAPVGVLGDGECNTLLLCPVCFQSVREYVFSS